MSNHMFKRKLSTIYYPNLDSFNLEDEQCFKNLISWLEDQKIRHYKIEDRKSLRDLNSPNWNDSCLQYLNDLSCPFDLNDRVSVADWLITFALKLEFEDNLDFYKNELNNKLSNNMVNMKKTNPLDSLDFESTEFRESVKKLANYLKIPVHTDNLITLKAILNYINTRINENEQDQLKNKKSIYKLEDIPLGFEVNNNDLKDALKLLRLLYIHNLRELQTNINQIIAQTQSITANPVTDSSLGKVGR